MKPLVPPPIVVAIVGTAMYFVDAKLGLMKVTIAWQTPVATILLATGLLLMLVAVVAFIAAKTTINPMRPSRASHLMTTGIYSVSRNPIYLADVIVLAACAVWLGNLANIALLAIFAAYIHKFQILPEEQALSRIFGEDYTTYCLRVRRWL
jgi:protein-S-isoprenylcysteine O-methyltransferase Ste14